MKLNRRQLGSVAAFGTLAANLPALAANERRAEVIIIGAGLGGCAAAIAALRNGRRVVMTEASDWIGGQLTNQAVPPDEHRWIETKGANQSYRTLRNRIRKHYRSSYPLTSEARKREYLNPGNGNVSRLCVEPRVALAVLEDWLKPFEHSGQLVVLRQHRPISAEVSQDRVRSVAVKSLRSEDQVELIGEYFIDATELGELLPMTGAEMVTGAESKAQTGELHASEQADPQNHQAFTICFAIDHLPGEHHVIDRPAEYDFWRDFVPEMTPPWPGKLLDLTYSQPSTLQPKRLGFDPQGGSSVNGALNLWTYRRIIDDSLFQPGRFDSDISLINWPQNDYFLGSLIDVPEEQAAEHVRRAKQLSFSLLYWLQTEAPRPDGNVGFPGLRLRGDLMGTTDGLAKMPYVRESRRIQAIFTVLEEHVGRENRALVTGEPQAEVKAADFFDSVGVGSYHIDLHPSTGGDNYIDFPSLPFQIPLGALLPVRMMNLLPANKNIGTTHVTNGCYRLHPVEWGIGEAVGCLADYALSTGRTPHEVRDNRAWLAEFQQVIRDQGIETHW